MTKRIYPPPPTRFAGPPAQAAPAAGSRPAGARATYPPPPTRYGMKPAQAGPGPGRALQPAARPTIARLMPPPPPRVGGGSRVVQRATNIAESVWTTNHQGTIALGSGSEETNSLRQKVSEPTAATDATETAGAMRAGDGIFVVIKEIDLNHFCTGHTIREFAFDDANIDRSGRSNFWPAATTKAGVLAIATAVLRTLHDDIKAAVGQETSVNHASYEHAGVKYVVTISVAAETGDDAPTDDDGNYLAGTARLEQFYPISGTGIIYADKADLHALKIRLGK